MRRFFAILAVVCWVSLASFACAATHVYRPAPVGPAPAGPTRNVILVGNSVSGTVSVIDGTTFASLGSIDIIPDLEQRLREINSPLTFWRRGLYRRIKRAQLLTKFEPNDANGAPGTGDRFVDDLFLSPDGGTLYVSRSNLGDVAAFDLRADGFPMIWRTTVKGRKADHATISADGARIVVSASVARRAHVIDTRDGHIVGSFRTGILPHQNDYSANGERIYNGSLGLLDLSHARNALKGPRLLTVVDAKTLKIVRTYPFEFGVRPTVIMDDESTMYAQLSYLNGLIKFDLKEGRTIATLQQPKSEFANANYANEDDFPHNSAHHGLAMSGDGSLLCDCGTIDNSVSIVSTAEMKVVQTIEKVGAMPYWATTSADGRRCVISLSGDDAIVVIDFHTRQEIARVPVGHFPQRNRVGLMAEDVITRLARQPH